MKQQHRSFVTVLSRAIRVAHDDVFVRRFQCGGELGGLTLKNLVALAFQDQHGVWILPMSCAVRV